jgi:CRP/FNR family transcriptional regulator
MATMRARTRGMPGPEPFRLLGVFDGIPQHQAGALERAFPALAWPVGQTIPEGDDDAELVLVRGGIVAAMSGTARGRPVATALLQPGDVYPADTREAGAHLMPFEDAWISYVSFARLRVLVERAPRLGTHLLRGLTGQLLEAGRAAGVLSELRVEDRLLGTFVRLARRHAIVTAHGVELTLPLSHAQWATLVGASREAVTAALIRLRRRGMVQCRGRVIVLSAEALLGDESHREEPAAAVA